MVKSNHLLFIDTEPVDKNLKDYFDPFDLNIIEQKTLLSIDFEQTIPHAIFIHWSILKNELDRMEQLYRDYIAPIVIITDMPDEDISIRVLELGADDCVSKPISPKELHARIRAINRRIRKSTYPIHHEKEVLSFCTFHLYPASRQVFDDNSCELQLSTGEYELLFTFVQNPQRLLDREFLLHKTKCSHLTPFDRRIDIQVSRLRQKIEPDPKKPVLIQTIRNGGYLFTPRVTSHSLDNAI